MKQVYADYAAATPTDPRVVSRMSEVASEAFGNPSSRHSFGRQAEMMLNDSRSSIGKFLNAEPEEMYFTASGTESNNLAILGLARANKSRGNHIITSAIEHPSVMNACQALERDGFEVTHIPVMSDGRIDPLELKKAMRPTTILVSIHLANSEIGVIQDIKRLAAIAKEHNAVFHTDACQGAALLSLDIQSLGVDALTFNGSKLYGPRGVAALFVRNGISIFPLIYGGGQEQSLRSGTENLPAIAGLARATEIVIENREEYSRQIELLRASLQKELQKLNCEINCLTADRLPNHLSVIIPTDKTDLVGELDQRGIAVSSGSACSSRSQTDSHILRAIGLSSEQINKTVRISLGKESSSDDVVSIVQAISQLV